MLVVSADCRFELSLLQAAIKITSLITFQLKDPLPAASTRDIAY